MPLAVMISLALFPRWQIEVNIPIKGKNPRNKKIPNFEDSPDLSLATCNSMFWKVKHS
jgi:hypothetical protein